MHVKITPRISESGFSNSKHAFDDFFATLRPSLKLWDYFVNWDKVFRNTKQIEIHLNLWNYLLGKVDFVTYVGLRMVYPCIWHMR